MRRFGLIVLCIFAAVGFLLSAEILYVAIQHRVATKCVDEDDEDMTHFAIPTRHAIRSMTSGV